MSEESAEQTTTPDLTRWWGEYDFSATHYRCWRFGPLTFALERNPQEWIVRSSYNEDPAAERNHWEVTNTPVAGFEASDDSRIVFKTSPDKIKLKPVMPDRSVVVSPSVKLTIPKSESVTIYVSVLAWLKAETSSPVTKLIDTHIVRLSDTWFGPDKMDGDLCYSSRTRARLSYPTEEVRPYRVMVPVTLSNQSKQSFKVNKINLPVQNLPIFTNATGELWGPGIDLIKQESEDEARIRINTSPPASAGHCTKVAAPRQTVDSPTLFARISDLFD